MTSKPIACSLSASQQDQRLGETHELVLAALIDAKETVGGARFRFRAEGEGDLRRLIAAESRCCPFLDFGLERDGADLVLEVQGPPEAQTIIAGLFGPETGISG